MEVQMMCSAQRLQMQDAIHLRDMEVEVALP